jgi:hypothetical protein
MGVEKGNLDLTIEKPGECGIPSPLNGKKYVSDEDHVLRHSNLNDIKKLLKAKKPVPVFELAGSIGCRPAGGQARSTPKSPR